MMMMDVVECTENYACATIVGRSYVSCPCYRSLILSYCSAHDHIAGPGGDTEVCCWRLSSDERELKYRAFRPLRPRVIFLVLRWANETVLRHQILNEFHHSEKERERTPLDFERRIICDVRFVYNW